MHPPYRREGATWQIDLQLDHLQQLVNSMDPTPFPGRDLDPDAERYIVDAARELPGAENAARVGAMLGHYFQWEAESAGRRLREHLHAAWRTTLLGLAFMALCMLARSLLLPVDGLPAHTAAEGLLVIGWVALWRPLEMFLYDWWPLRREARLMRRLTGLAVSLRAGTRHPLAAVAG